MNQSINIFIASAEDATVLKRLRESIAKESYFIQYDLVDNSREESLLKKARNLKNGFVLLLAINNKTIGFLRLDKFGTSGGYIKMGILSEYCSKGYGNRLLDALFKECAKRDIIKLHLWVSVDNGQAKVLYEKNGFHIEDEKDLKPFGQHYWMTKRLRNNCDD